MCYKTTMKTKPVDDLIYAPIDAVTAATQHLQSSRDAIKSGLGLHFPIPDIAESYPVPPLLPGKVFTIAAVTSHGKSTFKEFWIADAARRIEDHKSNEHVLISVSAEDMVEDQMIDTMRKRAARDGDIESVSSSDGLLEIAGRIGSVPIYYIGLSLMRASFDNPPVNMSNIAKACQRLVERRKDKGLGTVVMGVFLDYIQALDIDHDIMRSVADKRRHLQVGRDFSSFRKLCAALPAPGVCCAQCKAVLQYAPGKNMQIPGLLDIQEASAIAQYTDRALSIWMPKNTHTLDTVLEHGEITFRVLQNLAWMKITKQRCKDPTTLMGLPTGRSWPLEMLFQTGEYQAFDDAADTLSYNVQTRYQKRTEAGKDPNSDW